MNQSTPTTLYRLYDAEGDLLYVGISTRPMQRVREHSKGQTWWLEVASQSFEHFPSRPDAAAAELAAIRAEKPRYNKVGVVVPHTRGFTGWLRRQRDRLDAVGDFARDVRADPLWPKPKNLPSLQQYMRACESDGLADERAVSAALQAWREYEAQGAV